MQVAGVLNLVSVLIPRKATVDQDTVSRVHLVVRVIKRHPIPPHRRVQEPKEFQMAPVVVAVPVRANVLVGLDLSQRVPRAMVPVPQENNVMVVVLLVEVVPSHVKPLTVMFPSVMERRFVMVDVKEVAATKSVNPTTTKPMPTVRPTVTHHRQVEQDREQELLGNLTVDPTKSVPFVMGWVEQPMEHAPLRINST